MPAALKLDHVERVLKELLATAMPGATINVQPPSRWKRPVVVIRWDGFSGLLAEQRFRRVMQRIPTATLERDLHGLIWFELTPAEQIEDYLKMPRSEDVAERADVIIRQAAAKGVFEKLEKALGDDPAGACGGDFALLMKAQKTLKVAAKPAQELCLALIQKGAYCDCEAIESAAGE
ncbi:MAG: hypothetical protein IT449_02150 [Phycisphaerales bacterium]|nr:hypothetical protein [Phycisphaerales bacterium]